MYRHCIFCSADLGANDALEAFPVGRTVAFDGAKGRLWAVCSRCGRWNLAPLEERWEAIEAAERRFVDTRLRVQSENVGLAKLPDGTRLIRVGQAVPGELAAWRYGRELRKRHHLHLATSTAVTVGTLLLPPVLTAYTVGRRLWNEVRQRQVVYRVDAADSPTGSQLLVRRWHVRDAQLTLAGDGETVQVALPDVHRGSPRLRLPGMARYTGRLALEGPVARAVLGRGLVHVNHRGASRDHVEWALRLLSRSGTAEDYLRLVARGGGVLDKTSGDETRRLTREGKLALEMAVHDEQERRALRGELAVLEAAWREAEEIAAIADALPGAPPARLAPG